MIMKSNCPGVAGRKKHPKPRKVFYPIILVPKTLITTFGQPIIKLENLPQMFFDLKTASKGKFQTIFKLELHWQTQD
jgi:hypothetical protein